MYVMVERRYEIKDTLAFVIDWENEEKHRSDLGAEGRNQELHFGISFPRCLLVTGKDVSRRKLGVPRLKIGIWRSSAQREQDEIT